MREISRRSVVALGAAGVLAACRRDLLTPTHAPPLHAHRLAEGFPALVSRALPGTFAFGIMCLDTTELWCSDRAATYPLDAAVGLPIAAAAMARVDAGALALDQRVGFDAGELSPPPSAIDARWPDPPDNTTGAVAIAELFRLALGGDNTAIDLLMKQAGGPGAVQGFVQEKNLAGLVVDRYRREAISDLYGLAPFRPAWKDEAAVDAARAQIAPADRLTAMRAFVRDPRDAVTVPGALGFLASLSDHELASTAGTDRLMHWMAAGSDLGFRAGLPGKASLVQASAAAPADAGVAPVSASLAIATLPDGTRYALAGFLTLATADEAARRALFADAAALAASAIG